MMTKRLLDIDDAALLDAQRILETRTMKETVNEALRLVTRIERSRNWVDLVSSEDFDDLRNSDVMGGAWR
jgi:Arc/MetJ family transcription regulator